MEIPDAANHEISVANCDPAGTSENDTTFSTTGSAATADGNTNNPGATTTNTTATNHATPRRNTATPTHRRHPDNTQKTN
ncbi:hypothetical protein AAur_3133 [Paenarthrobacter aurescens TC1]|uniref:Uncharacterized protein n=1 Tax=Paenarthrobacter aurescens (strain TC1) TaxID=290340 RepID=A1R9C1_PAEAT|nr:hypothetical protein AAur_3133 [Paenarthrobacter aurescens TC1]